LAEKPETDPKKTEPNRKKHNPSALTSANPPAVDYQNQKQTGP